MSDRNIPNIFRLLLSDMTVGDTEFEGPAPFYKETSKIVKRQYALHRMLSF